MAIGNKLVRKQRVVDSLFKRKKKSLGEAKKKYVSLSNYLERANDKLEDQDDIADKDLKNLSLVISKLITKVKVRRVMS